jgi:putative membrane protein
MLLMHFFGFLGISTKIFSEWFIALTPLNLLVSVFFLGFWHQKNIKNAWIFAFLTLSLGYFAEVAGVFTGQIFGVYAYGKTLGWKLFDVPLLIGVNWAMLVYCANNITEKINILFLRAPFAAALMTGLDFFIEPLAIRCDMWHWFGAEPPLQNYIAWFFLAYFLSILYQKLLSGNKNPYAIWLFAAQTFFFTASFFAEKLF